MKNNLLQKNIPKGWNVIKLGNPNVAIINPEQIDPQKQEDSIFEYIDIGAISNNKILGVKQFSGKDSPSRARRLVQEGDVIISTVRPNLKAVAFISKKYSGSIVSTGFCVLRGNINYVDKNFIYQIVLADKFTDFLISKTKGSNYPAVSFYDVEDYDMMVPPIQEQKKIAEILSSVDEEIQKVDELILKTEELKKGLMTELFTKGIGHKKFKKTKIGMIPEEWEFVSLSKLFKLSSGKGLSKSKFVSGEFIVYGGNGITGNHNEFILEKQTIIIGRVGEYCGAVHLTRPYSWVTDNALYIEKYFVDTEQKYIYYMLHFLNLNQYAKVGGQPSISQDTVGCIEIGLPNINEQKKIAEILFSVDKKIETNKNLKDKLTQFKKGLMSDLLSGKVRVNI